MPGGEDTPMATDRDALKALAEQGSDVPAAVTALTRLAIETPSWGYGNSGTRFAVFPWPGPAARGWRKVVAARRVPRLTATGHSLATHFPWTRVTSGSR